MINEIINTVKENEIKAVQGVVSTVNEYFKPIHWSIEKDEWDRMTKTQKTKFSKEVLKAAQK